MKFAIFSHVDHCKSNNKYVAYAPYVREMNLWIKHFDEVEVVAHLSDRPILNIDLAYEHSKITFTNIKAFNITSIKNLFLSLIYIPTILFVIFKAMKGADHIHLRCPGNVGLLACLVQILFPSKPKTAKYAGNWDPKSKQPWSYRLQKWILNNTFLTKNMQVLVYGNWEGTTKNIKPFFTATYSNLEAEISNKLPVKSIDINEQIKFIFVGSLSTGKRPFYALQLFDQINKVYSNATLSFYGEGVMRKDLEDYISKNNLNDKVFLHGNQSSETVLESFKNSHFLILGSKSEGWPKVVAESMFWGCVPLTTKVSCVEEMIGYGERGLLLEIDLEKDSEKVIQIINNSDNYKSMSHKGRIWSTQFTTDKFDAEIKKLLN